MTFSIKDHPFCIREKPLPPQEIAAWVLGETLVEQAKPKLRKEAFRRVAKKITSGKAERSKYGSTPTATARSQGRWSGRSKQG
ncbi:hypothetical protein [Caulobacter endophyticus]|uniref:Uncharacterized protein n=1 Tax=Caulobacter endophyticus TaxID=2172652 RepID=A0A2T9KCK9_9CAUL|nr:hypothetical protein [Caulobacter endophyticus]PVM93623.1 hypothetical protein DDF67_02730 [Caulobacter endophyticus]